MTDHAIQFTVMIIYAVTLVVLAVYTWETHKLRIAAWEQVESLSKPCLTLWAKLRDGADAILEMDGAVGNLDLRANDAQFVVHNIGNGVALNVRYVFRSLEAGAAQDKTERYFVRVLAGEKISMPEPINASSYSGAYELVFWFESIGGTKYESVTRLQRRTLTQFTFNKVT